MKKVLEVKNVTKIYKIYKSNFDRLKEVFFKKKYHKEFISNNNISFDLYDGETLGIIGVNGAGKSTILKQIVGVVSPTSGEIIKKGRITALLELGTGFNNEVTGLENIFLNGTLIGMSNKECEDKKDAIIAFSELGDYINEPIKTYSSGMVMRLAFSIAIYSEPQTLIVDEALSVGDAHFQAKCTKALKERKDRNMSIIYVSHDLNSLKLLCDRIILLNKGNVISEGNPQDIVNEYNFLISKLDDNIEEIKIDEESNSFGTFDVKIKNISINCENRFNDNFQSGDLVEVKIELFSKIDLEDLTIGIHIRDKFGQNIYGTKTFFQEKKISVKKERNYICTYFIKLNMGAGMYTLGAAVHRIDTHIDSCYHWIDSAIKFSIHIDNDKFWTGLSRLEPKIEFKES